MRLPPEKTKRGRIFLSCLGVACLAMAPGLLSSAKAQNYGAQTYTYGVQRGPSYDYTGSNSARAYQGTANPLTSRVNQQPVELDDTSITELSSCANAISTLEAAYQQGGASYDVLSRMALDSVATYIPQDRNGTPLPGVSHFMFNKLVSFCKSNPNKTLGNGAEYAKDSLDELIINAIPK